MDLIEALESEGRNDGYNIILHNSQNDSTREIDNIQNFLARQVDGILLMPTSDIDLTILKKIHVPIVMITQFKEKFDSIAISHKKGGSMVADHFIQNGHHNFAYIGPKSDDKLYGFKESIYNNGFNFEEDHLIELTNATNSSYVIREEIQTYLNSHPHPNFSAVFCVNDVTAFEFTKLLEERGLNKSDFSIVGFDDTILAKSLSITSIQQPIKEMARIGFQTLLERIEGTLDGPAQMIELEPLLMIRKSSIQKVKSR